MLSKLKILNLPEKLNLSIFNNSLKLSSNEYKNLSILILAKQKLSYFVKLNPHDIFINNLFSWFEDNIIDFKDIELLYNLYFEAKEGTELKKDLFKIVKPLEELAVYLSKIAALTNELQIENTVKENEQLLKAFVYCVLCHWFDPKGIYKKNTFYFKEIYSFDFYNELIKLSTNTEGFGYRKKSPDSEERKVLNQLYDDSFKLIDFISSFSFKIIIPKKAIKGKKRTCKKIKTT